MEVGWRAPSIVTRVARTFANVDPHGNTAVHWRLARRTIRCRKIIPMIRCILVCVCLLAMPLIGDVPAAVPCPQERPRPIVHALPAAFGSSPLWLSIDADAAWTGSSDPLPVMWIRDRRVTGLAVVTGRDRVTGARARFGRSESTLQSKAERYQLGWTGTRPPLVTATDLARYVFAPTDVWFPRPGCYEMIASVGRTKSVFVLSVEKDKGRATRSTSSPERRAPLFQGPPGS